MMILLTLGMMNPFVMVGITVVIAAEKLLPRAEIVAHFVGVAVIVAGVIIISRTQPRSDRKAKSGGAYEGDSMQKSDQHTP